MQKKNATGNTKIRQEHRHEILNVIRKLGPISRTEIFRKTSISKPTVTRVIEGLLESEIIHETGVGKTYVGRKPICLELNPGAYYCVGVNISRNHIYASVVDLCMNIIGKSTVSIKGLNNADAFIQRILSIVGRLILSTGIRQNKILGVGIGVPGIVDYEEGVVVDFAASHSLVDIQLKKELESALNLNVVIDNNANTRALGEYWYGYGMGYKDIIFVICDEGVGSGIINEGNIIRGKSNVAGELGHMTINIDGRKCTCGQYGCIEAYCSIESIEREVRESIMQGRPSYLQERVQGDIDTIDFSMICEGAKGQDPLCLEHIDLCASALSTGLSNVVGLFNPEMIILSGRIFDELDWFDEYIKEKTRERIGISLARDVVFKKRKLKDNLYEIGAATLVFKMYFND